MSRTPVGSALRSPTSPPPPATVTPVITSINPGSLLVGGTAAVTIGGAGFGGSPSVNLPGGFTATVESASDSTIVLSLAIAPSAVLGDSSISVTAGGQTSNGENFVADYPTHVLVQTDLTEHCGGCSTTVQRIVTYQAVTFAGQPAAGIELGEVPTLGTWSCVSPAQGNQSVNYLSCPSATYTDSNGEFSDTWGFTSDDVAPGGCGVQVTSDHYEWCLPNKTFATLGGEITATAVTMNGYTNPPNAFPTLFSIGP
jgi:hypothetical protein